MTTATLPGFVPSPSFGRRVWSLLTALVEGIIEGRDIATRYERLRHMSDSDLARLHLTRADLPAAAVNGVASR